MDIRTCLSTDFVEHTPDTRVSKLSGTFADPSVRGVVIRGDEFHGVVTRRQLATSHHPPETKLKSLVWTVPRLAPDEDVRRVAQLMLDSDSFILPVFEDGNLTGVVTVDGILEAVCEHLDAATVQDTFTQNLHTITPDETFGKALSILRENRFTHLPVVEADAPVGILSLYDLTSVTVRQMDASQGGDAGGVDPFGGDISSEAARSRRGGYGAREGERQRILQLPVRDFMVSPVRTTAPETTLDTAVEEMWDVGGSSLLVEDDELLGILTKTDVLETLTWEAPDTRAVQVYGTRLLTDVSYEAIVELIDDLEARDSDMTILDAKVHLHDHDETYRGVPLILVRIRLHTDRGLYMASGEGYGDKHAITEARHVLERRIRDKKTYGKSKKPRDAEFWDRRFGWLLEGDE